MLQAMFSGVSGLLAHQEEIDVIGNNIANVNTPGYRAANVTFEDQLSQTLRSAAGPTSTLGGQNPLQVGLGVLAGAIGTNQTQGNLQSTGNNTDLAIQGNGYFMVGSGSNIYYTRNGSFALDSAGNLVYASTGMKLLGYQASPSGVIDPTQPVTSASSITIPLGTLTSVAPTQNIGMVGNLDGAVAQASTNVAYRGNLDSTATPSTSTPSPLTTTVYDSMGNAHTVEVTFSNPVDGSPLTSPPAPAGSTRSWDVQVKVDGTTTFDSSTGNKSKLYSTSSGFTFASLSTGASLGADINLNGQSGDNNTSEVPGTGGAPAFPLTLNFSALTDTAGTSTLGGVADGQAGGPPNWSTSVTAYDSLGVGHLVTFNYNRVSLGSNPPIGATQRWDWSAQVAGSTVASDTTSGNSPLYFDANGKLISGSTQNLSIPLSNGATTPASVTVNMSSITQLAGDSSVTVGSQDGYSLGTLQSFTISQSGLLTGVFSNGQTRTIGQIALGTFTNPSGLEKIGDNMFRASSNSGLPQVGMANNNGNGTINPGFLEMSNVDLSTEFADLIVTERGFQANTKIVTAVDQLLQNVINMMQ